MSITRREFLLAGSAASTLWLTGCGGGGSADGAPKAKVATPSVCGPEAAIVPDLNIVFSNVSGVFPSASVAMMPTANLQIMGCTNPLVAGVQTTVQELFVNIVQRLTGCESQAGAADLVRSLSLHLAIPRDASGSAPELSTGMVFNYGDASNTAIRAFDGLLVVNDPGSSQNWAYQITSGTVEIMDGFNPLGIGKLKLTNVVASAAAAGANRNEGTGTLSLNGTVSFLFDFMSAIG